LGTPTLYPTGGLGGGDSSGPIPIGPHDGLTTERSLITNQAATRLYAVNGGDNTVTAFSINQVDGSLTLLTIYDSGGEQPASLSLSPDETVLYILDNGANGRLTAQPINENRRYNAGVGSTHVTVQQTVDTYPHNFTVGLETLGSVLADPSGKWVLVSEKYASTIKAYKLTRRGRLFPREQYPPVITQNTRAWTWSMNFYTPTLLTVSVLTPVPFSNPVGPDSWTQTWRWNYLTGTLTLVSEKDTGGGNTCWQIHAVNDVWYGLGPTRPIITGWKIDQNTGLVTLLPTSQTGMVAGSVNNDTNYGAGDVWTSPDGYLYFNGQIPGDESRQTSPCFHSFNINPNGTLTHVFQITTGRPIQGAAGY